MKYQVFGNTIVARMDRGEEILAEVKEICTRENIRLASISALGAVSHVLVGLYQMENKSYYSITLDKDMELTALVGNVTTRMEKFTCICTQPFPILTAMRSAGI